MSTCIVGGCNNKKVHNNEDPIDVRFCERHMAAWNASGEHDRATEIIDLDGSRDSDGRYDVAVMDFARRMEAEERNAPKGTT